MKAQLKTYKINNINWDTNIPQSTPQQQHQIPTTGHIPSPEKLLPERRYQFWQSCSTHKNLFFVHIDNSNNSNNKNYKTYFPLICGIESNCANNQSSEQKRLNKHTHKYRKRHLYSSCCSRIQPVPFFSFSAVFFPLFFQFWIDQNS